MNSSHRLTDSVVVPFPSITDPQARLRLALAGLERAVAAQQESVARWRASLGELQSEVRRVDASLRTFRGDLASLALAIDELGAEAGQLEHLAGSASA